MTDVDLKMIKHDGRKYGAGRCIVTIGKAPIAGVALYADPNKIILGSPELAEKWLVKHGLPRNEASKLLESIA